MSNLDTVINFIKVEPDYDKKDMIEKIMRTFNTSKSNAQAYLYNAHKKLGKPAAPKPVKAPKTAVKGRSFNGRRSSNVDPVAIQAELDRVNKELDAFEASMKKNKRLWDLLQV
jgi:DNA gyrase/topoisomerase IV subunit A